MRKAKRKPFAKAQRSWEGKTQRYEKVVLQGFHLSSVSLKKLFFRLWAVSYFSLQSYCTRNLSMRAAIREAIALAEIRARPILSNKKGRLQAVCCFFTQCVKPCANNSQHCWMLHVASVFTPCCMLLRVVGSCYAKLKPIKLLATWKQTQHCWELLRLFACSLKKIMKKGKYIADRHCTTQKKVR